MAVHWGYHHRITYSAVLHFESPATNSVRNSISHRTNRNENNQIQDELGEPQLCSYQKTMTGNYPTIRLFKQTLLRKQN